MKLRFSASAWCYNNVQTTAASIEQDEIFMSSIISKANPKGEVYVENCNAGMKCIEYFMYDAVKLEQMAFENADKVGGQNASSSASQAASAATNSSADLEEKDACAIFCRGFVMDLSGFRTVQCYRQCLTMSECYAGLLAAHAGASFPLSAC